MSPFVIRTAVPFGYLIAYGALLGLGVLGLVWLVGGVRRRRAGRALFGALAAGVAGYVLWVNEAEGRALDLNPSLGAPEQLVGAWRGDADAVLTLAADGAYRCAGAGECRALGRVGTWARAGDFDVALRPAAAGGAGASGRVARYRVVAYRGRLRLAHPIDDDPDSWDGALLFAHESADSAAAPSRSARRPGR